MSAAKATAKPVKAATEQQPEEEPRETDREEIDQEEFEPVLTLDTLDTRRNTVLIKTPNDREGTLYEMLNPDELGIEEEQIFRNELREFSQLSGKEGKLTKAEKKRLEHRLGELTKKVLFAPAAVHRELSPRKKQKVITNFTGALFAEDAAAVDQAMMARLIGSTMGS